MRVSSISRCALFHKWPGRSSAWPRGLQDADRNRRFEGADQAPLKPPYSGDKLPGANGVPFGRVHCSRPHFHESASGKCHTKAIPHDYCHVARRNKNLNRWPVSCETRNVRPFTGKCDAGGRRDLSSEKIGRFSEKSCKAVLTWHGGWVFATVRRSKSTVPNVSTHA